MRPLARLATLSALLVCVLSASSARAQGAPADPNPAGRNAAAAEKLFKEAIEAEDKGDWEKACSLYDASFKLDPSVGTQLNVGRCAEHFGRLATAWAIFQKARTLNRETIGEQRKAEVEKFLDDANGRLQGRLPTLSIEMKTRPPGLVVKCDGADLPVESLGQQIPIDPGKHELVFRAPGYKTHTRQLDIPEGKKEALVVELVAGADTIEPPKTTPSGSHPQLVAGIVLGVAGGLALVGSAITGGLTLSKRSELDDLLAPNGSCTESDGALSCSSQSDTTAAEALSSDGSTLGVATTALMIGGAALAATGIIVAVTAPRRAASAQGQVTILPSVGGVVVSGRF